MFQKAIIKKYLTSQNKELLHTKWDLYRDFFHNKGNQERIRELKEEQFQEGFLKELFVKIFDYIITPNENYNLITEFKNVKDSKKVDGVLFFNGSVKCVIELKGTNTIDLAKVEVQAFSYKSNQTNCNYVITSNFEKLRFYIEDAIEFIEFDLFELTQDEFNTMFLCLSSYSIENDIPLKLKLESISEEDLITKQLYQDYSLFKRELFQNLILLNEGYDKLLLFKKSQKLLDRFLFLFFAEDRFLLPPNSVRLILDDWEQLIERDVEVHLYNRFKKYFGYLNTGFKGKRYDVFPYNGGLFKSDEVLDNIIIDDTLLFKHCKKLSEYDFESEVDVNILGHIFENSLNEIEEISNELKNGEVDKTNSKRKKDGVFYTPKYITKYIVNNTIGKLCIEKKNELQINDEDYTTDKKRIKKTIKTLSDKLTEYRKWLLQLTICDPACGSGAFLNQSLNFLISEHQYIDELQSKLFGDSMVLSDIENSILENNLFGVDINEESVEITKLSLWLRTAQPNRKLNNLSSNIKCGNSLIDEPFEGVENYFKWETEFPKVFEKGGFDVVIGNPPYVRQELFKEIKPFLEKNYESYNSISDLYTYFIEKGIKLMNTKGLFSFILPNKFIRANYGKEIRKFIMDNCFINIIFDFDDYPIFSDATTYPIIFVFSKENNSKTNSFRFSEINKRIKITDPINYLENNSMIVSYNSLNEDSWDIVDIENEKILLKIKKNSVSLKNYVDNKIFRGVSTGKNEVFIIEKDIADKLRNEENKHLIREIVTGKEVKRYGLNYNNLYLLFLDWEYEIDFDKNIKEYLLEHKNLLSERPEVRDNRFNWWCLSRYGSKNSKYLFKPKIIYPRINNECNFYLDESGTISLSDNNFFISSKDKFLLTLLNSKVIFYFLKSIASTLQGGYLDFRRPYIEQIPIKLTDDSNKLIFEEKGELLLSLNKKFQEKSDKFKRILQRKFKIEKHPKKLQDWYVLTFGEFIKELTKQKVKLSLTEESEWEEFFTQESKKVLELKSSIDKTDKEIDMMVYELYGLTDEEIKIIETSN